MKILNKTQFLQINSPVLYSRYSPCSFEGLEIKEENFSENDFWYQDLLGSIQTDKEPNKIDPQIDVLIRCEKTGESFELDLDCLDRDGLYESNALYAVYEKDDVIRLIERLKKIL
jgi:hypothetical protein